MHLHYNPNILLGGLLTHKPYNYLKSKALFSMFPDTQSTLVLDFYPIKLVANISFKIEKNTLICYQYDHILT